MTRTGAAVDDRERVLAWFADGTLVRPRADGAADLVDLMRALRDTCLGGPPTDTNRRRLGGLIGEADHLVFVLVDGLGSELLRDLARGEGFLSSHLAEPLQAVYPSTTAASLTSIATGEHPSHHAVLGWHTRLPELGITAEILPFVERFSKRPLADYGARAEAIFAVPSLLPHLGRDAVAVTRRYIADSTYSLYWSGGIANLGYDHIEEGVDTVIARVRAATAPTYTHLYLNQLDTICHELGVHHPAVAALFARIDAEVERLYNDLDGGIRLVVTADHGHVDAGEDHLLPSAHPLARLLACPPSGEPRAPLFHVRFGEAERFAEGFREEFGEHFALLAQSQVEEIGLIGPAPWSEVARARFGDFVAIAPAARTFHWSDPALKPHRHRGVHAGLTPGEMLVPLIVA